MSMTNLRVNIVFVILLGWSTPVIGQGKPASVKSLLEKAKNKGQENVLAVAFQRVLKEGKASPETIDSLADGLVTVAKSTTDPIVESMALTMLTMAKDPHGNHFGGAFDRLLDIYKNAVDQPMRWGALMSLGEVDVRRAIPVWSEVATRAQNPSDVMGPTAAIQSLCEQGGAEGKKTLEQLYENSSVTDPEARQLLGIIYGSKFTLGCNKK